MSGDPARGHVNRVQPAVPRRLGHVRVVVAEDGRPLVEAFVPAAGLDATLAGLARDPGPDLDAAFRACGHPAGMAEGALLALAAVLLGDQGRHARDRLAAALGTAGSAVVRVSRVRRTRVVRASVHEDAGGAPPSGALARALAASRAGCPVLTLMGDRAARVAAGLAADRVALAGPSEG